eukprot:Gb_39526 [translate_table: standard]
MAQTRVNKPRSVSMVRKSANANAKGNAKANGNLSSPQAIFELKQRVILVLNKLADRDTYQIAVEELQRIAETLSPEGFGPFLSCIFETDSQQKSTVRRECVKVFATLAGFHGELLAPHLPKMVGSIIRRLKDPDSNVRDACVDAIGVLASKIMHPSGNSGVENGGPFSVFVKPLFEALGEQNRQLQAGSALCLARVIDNAEDPPVSTLQRILPRIMKLLSNQSFSANAALLSVIGSIVQAGGASTQQTLSVLVPCMLGTLQSSDWTTRKAAAEAFARMALGLGPLLTSFKSSCLTALESCRFDKVKPVRDAVVQTLQAWKSIPDSKSSSPLTEKGASLKENVCEGGVSVDCKSTIPTVRKSTFLRKSVTSVAKSASDSNSFGNSSTDTTPCSKPTTELTPTNDGPSEQKNRDNQRSDSLTTETSTGSSTNFEDGFNSRSSNDLAFIRKQLFQIENQQSSLLELLQAFMGSSLESICSLETRVHGLEMILDEMAQDLALSTGRLSKMEARSKCCRFLGADMLRSKFWNINESRYTPSRLAASDTFPSMSHFGLEAPSKAENGTADVWEDGNYGCARRSFMVNPLAGVHSTSCKGNVYSPSDSNWRPMQDNAEGNQTLHRALERTAFKDRFVRGSLEKNIWKSSKYEASLCSTQFAQGNDQTNMLEIRDSRPNPPDTSSKSSTCENGRFWSVWTRAIEHLCTEDVDSAFVEVLCSGDDLLLIQLMKRTGPALENLSQGTVVEILQTVIGLLLEQKFLDTIIPWLQQVVDLTTSNGPDYLGLSLEARMETLSALQEASSMHFSELSSRRCVTQLASKLANLWAGDLLRSS